MAKRRKQFSPQAITRLTHAVYFNLNFAKNYRQVMGYFFLKYNYLFEDFLADCIKL